MCIRQVPSRRPTCIKPGGEAFTLVELLVVIGIIAVMIAILLPALARAREQANLIKCLATLRNLHQAASLHANEHQGFMQAAGEFEQREIGVDSTPRGLGDPAMRRYLYYYNSRVPRLMPLPPALAQSMGVRLPFDSQSDVSMFAARPDVRRLFQCPSQDPATILAADTVIDDQSEAVAVYMSYVFNAAFLGRTRHSYGMAPTGQLSRVRRPANVFLFADGRAAPALNGASYAVFDVLTAEETMQEKALDRQIDPPRHRGLINVIFIDGHAGTFHLPSNMFNAMIGPGELDQIGISKGIYD